MTRFLLALLAASSLAVPALAADTEQSPWQVRVRAINVIPDEESTTTIGGKVTADSAIVPEVDFTYFFNPNWAAELIVATTPHDMGATGTSLGNLDLGDVWLLPPTLTLQYHFMPEGTFRPYVGAGLNYTMFYKADPVSVASIDYDNGFGYALQAGVDIPVKDKWFVNADIKKVFLNTKAKINGGAVSADVDLDPWILGVGLGYRF